MKTNLILFGFLTIVFLAVGFSTAKDVIKGNGTIVTKEIGITCYQSIFINENIEHNNNLFSKKENFQFFYEQIPGNSTLQISIDENLYPLLEIETDNDKLIIRTKDKTIIKPTKFLVSSTSETLKRVEVNSVVNFYAKKDVKSDTLNLSVSGVGDIKMDDLTCNQLRCDLSGVGNLILEGTAQTGDFHLSGVGNIKTYNLFVKDLKCHLSGVGNMQVNSIEKLEAHSSGVGNINYKGKASSINKHSSGIGRIKKVD